MPRFLPILLVSLLASTALAQDYDALIREAVRENRAGNYPEALALFEQAHELNPNARTLRALGAVSFELRRYVEALDYLDAALTDDRRPLTDAQRTEVVGLLERTQRFVGRFAVVVEGPSEWALFVDGAPIEGDTVTLAVGDHELEVRSEGWRTQRRDLRVTGGSEDATLTFVLEEEEPELGFPPVPRVADEPSHVASSIAFAAGGVGVVLFAIGGGWGLAEKGNLDDGCRTTSAGCTDDDVSRFRSLARTADAGWILALAGVATGLVLRFTVERADSDVEVTADGQGASLRWRRRF